MSIVTRVLRIFKADLHGILDAVEEPEAILRQALREMEEEIANTEAQLKRLERQEERLEKNRQDYTKQHQELEQEIGFCLNENNETLAKSLIRKKLEIVQWLKEISSQLCCVNDEKVLLTAELDDRKDKLKSIREKQGLFAARYKNDWTEQLDGSDDHLGSKSITEEDVELELLHQKQRYVKNSDGSPTGEFK